LRPDEGLCAVGGDHYIAYPTGNTADAGDIQVYRCNAFFDFIGDESKLFTLTYQQ
jgi:hypothetical protein